MVVIILPSTTKVEIIFLEWLWHVLKDLDQCRVNLCLKVRDKDDVHFLKKLATHVLCFLLQVLELEFLTHVH